MFHELLDNPNKIEPGKLQADARKDFPGAVRGSHLKLFRKGHCLPHPGKYVLIGVATYSPEELELLDQVNAAHTDWPSSGTVAVFNLLECQNPCQVLEYYGHPPLPPSTGTSGRDSFGQPLQSPVVGIWDGPQFIALVAGLHEAQRLLREQQFLK